MSLWYIVLVYVLANGQVYADVRYPTTPEYNSEVICNQAGNLLTKQEQDKLGSSEGTVYFSCRELKPEQYRSATVKGQDI